MPLQKIIYPDKRNRIAIWRMESSLEEMLSQLNQADKHAAELKSFKTELRKKEWIATRLLVQHFFGDQPQEIIYDEHGKPHFQDEIEHHLAISHSNELVGIMINPDKTIGLDLEAVSPRLQKVASKFLSEEEQSYCQLDDLEMLAVIWSCKESLYKLYGKKKLRFAEHLLIRPFTKSRKGSLEARLNIEDGMDLQMHYTILDDLVITWCEASNLG